MTDYPPRRIWDDMMGVWQNAIGQGLDASLRDIAVGDTVMGMTRALPAVGVITIGKVLSITPGERTHETIYELEYIDDGTTGVWTNELFLKVPDAMVSRIKASVGR